MRTRTVDMGFVMRRRVRLAVVAVTAVVLTVLGGQAPAAVGSTGAAVVAQSPGAPTTNKIVLENQRPGTTGWRIPYSGRTLANDVTKQVKGYLSSKSVKAGEAASLHVTTNPARTFSWSVYRLGWYAGSGGRLMASGSATGVTQPACPRDSTTGLIRCGWSRSVSIPTTTSWTSGVYVVVLTAGTYQNYATFVVRDDRKGAVVAVQPTNTYQAYNNHPDDGVSGKSLYDHNSYGPNTGSGDVRAVKVSFDRPYALSGLARIMADEAPFVRYAEARGFDVTYTTDVDVDLAPGQFNGQRAVVLPGHSEYWTASMYAQLETARDSGVDVSSLGANNVYWQARVEPSSTGAVGRTLVCYRRSTLDPHPTANLQTILHRDLGRPEQKLLGAQYMSPGSLVPGSHPWVARAPNHRAYRGTGLASGQSIPAGSRGYPAARATSLRPTAQPNWSRSPWPPPTEPGPPGC